MRYLLLFCGVIFSFQAVLADFYQYNKDGKEIFSEVRVDYTRKAMLFHQQGSPTWKKRAAALENNRTKYRSLIYRYAKTHGVPVKLVDSIIHIESMYDKDAVSPAGAVGLMQLMPQTAARFGVDDRNDPEKNIAGGVQYLKFLLDHYSDPRLAIAAYNAGEKAVDKYNGIPPYKETQQYVKKVLDLYNS